MAVVCRSALGRQLPMPLNSANGYNRPRLCKNIALDVQEICNKFDVRVNEIHDIKLQSAGPFQARRRRTVSLHRVHTKMTDAKFDTPHDAAFEALGKH